MSQKINNFNTQNDPTTPDFEATSTQDSSGAKVQHVIQEEQTNTMCLWDQNPVIDTADATSLTFVDPVDAAVNDIFRNQNTFEELVVKQILGPNSVSLDRELSSPPAPGTSFYHYKPIRKVVSENGVQPVSGQVSLSYSAANAFFAEVNFEDVNTSFPSDPDCQITASGNLFIVKFINKFDKDVVVGLSPADPAWIVTAGREEIINFKAAGLIIQNGQQIYLKTLDGDPFQGKFYMVGWR